MWLTKFQRSYKSRYGHESNVPRWNDIKDKYDLVTGKKIDKAKEILEVATLNVSKLEERILKYQEEVIEAKTEKQREKANSNIEKTRVQLDKAKAKQGEAQAQYDYLINL